MTDARRTGQRTSSVHVVDNHVISQCLARALPFSGVLQLRRVRPAVRKNALKQVFCDLLLHEPEPETLHALIKQYKANVARLPVNTTPEQREL